MWIQQFFCWTRTRAQVQSKKGGLLGTVIEHDSCLFVSAMQVIGTSPVPTQTQVTGGHRVSVPVMECKFTEDQKRYRLPKWFFVKHVWRQSDSRGDTPLFQMCLLVMWVMCHAFCCCCDIWIRSWRYWNKAASVPLPMLSRLASLFWCLANVTIHALQIVSIHEYLVGGLKYFCIFTPIWGNDPVWLIFFRWVETTNQITTTLPCGLLFPELRGFHCWHRMRLLLSLGPGHSNFWSGVCGSLGG